MSRGIHASTIAELAKDSFNMAHLVSIGFSTPIYLTDYSHDIAYGGNTYIANGYIKQLASVKETDEVQVGGFTLNLSGVDQAITSILLSENVIDRPVSVYRVVLDNDGNIIGDAIALYTGRISGFQMQESGTDSQINLNTASHFADFERKNGRYTNSASQKAHFPDDEGLDYASEVVKVLLWGRK